MFPDGIAKLFPNLFGQPSAMLVPSESNTLRSDQKLKIGVVLSGGQAPGGHNVISGIFGEDLIINDNYTSSFMHDLFLFSMDMISYESLYWWQITCRNAQKEAHCTGSKAVLLGS